MNWSYQIDYDNLKDKVLALGPKIRFYGQVTMLSIFFIYKKEQENSRWKFIKMTSHPLCYTVDWVVAELLEIGCNNWRRRFINIDSQ